MRKQVYFYDFDLHLRTLMFLTYTRTKLNELQCRLGGFSFPTSVHDVIGKTVGVKVQFLGVLEETFIASTKVSSRFTRRLVF